MVVQKGQHTVRLSEIPMQHLTEYVIMAVSAVTDISPAHTALGAQVRLTSLQVCKAL